MPPVVVMNSQLNSLSNNAGPSLLFASSKKAGVIRGQAVARIMIRSQSSPPLLQASWKGPTGPAGAGAAPR